MATMITLKCGDRLYKCPKERLIAHSDYFKALFSNSSAFADSAKTEFDYNELMQQQVNRHHMILLTAFANTF